MDTVLAPISVHRTAGAGRQWQFVDSADAWLWLASALAAKVMFPALPRAHVPGHEQLLSNVRFVRI